MLIARKGDTTTLGPKGRQTYEPSGPKGRSNLRTFPSGPFISIICMRSYVEKLLFLVYNTDKIQ